MQLAASIRAQANDVARIGRNFWFKQDDMKQRKKTLYAIISVEIIFIFLIGPERQETCSHYSQVGRLRPSLFEPWSTLIFTVLQMYEDRHAIVVATHKKNSSRLPRD
jgi:hypothetical protein